MAIGTATGTVKIQTEFLVKKTNTSLNPSTNRQSFATTCSFSSAGAGANAFNEEYCAVLTIAGGASTTLDLAGSLTNFFGETITFARVKVVVVELLETTTASSIQVGNATNPWAAFFGAGTHTARVFNGGFLAVAIDNAAGYASIAAGSTDELKILNNDGANSATVRVTLLGATS